jgi:Tfp pilus assembly protein PilV
MPLHKLPYIKKQTGFSILEVLLASAIFSFSTFGLLILNNKTAHNNKISQHTLAIQNSIANFMQQIYSYRDNAPRETYNGLSINSGNPSEILSSNTISNNNWISFAQELQNSLDQEQTFNAKICRSPLNSNSNITATNLACNTSGDLQLRIAIISNGKLSATYVIPI